MTTFAASSNTILHEDLAIPPALLELVAYLESLRARARLDILDDLLRESRVTVADLQPFCRFGVRGYLRNVIRRSEHFELLALCWRSGHCTPIHDHKGSSCAFKVVHGTGTEIRFKSTASGLIVPVATHLMEPGYVCSAEDDDIHQVANMQAQGQDLVTMHIYTPPIRKMNTYTFAVPGATTRPVDEYIDGEGV
jgi:cysteine dioxygenase